MATVLAILGWGLFGLAILIGLALDVVGLFGNWVIFGAVGIVWAATGFEHFGVWPLAVLAGLAVLGEVLETAAAGYGAARFGGNRRAAVAACVGCVLGAIAGTLWFPVVGTLAGACLGAFAGAVAHEYLNEQKETRQALWTGLGAALGKVAGLFAKVLVGLVMLLVAALTY